MRRCYLLCYDIREPRRLRRVHKVAKGFGQPWQYSIFFCILTDIDRIRLETTLGRIVNFAADQVLIIDLGPDVDLARKRATVLGPAVPAALTGTLVV